MDTTQWTQDIGLVTSMAAEIAPPNVTCSRPSSTLEKKVRPQKDEAINCPRCNSTNTKFCYYNNYSLTQPRYFCKTCRRYWTAGGTLRNVPVGGGSRKNRRPSSSSSSSSQRLPDLNPNPSMNLGNSQDLNLGFPSNIIHDHHNYFHGVPQFLELPKMENSYLMSTSTSTTSTSISPTTPISALDLLRTGIASRGLTSFISPNANANANALSFSSNGVQENGAKNIMFPFGCSLKQFSGTTSTTDQAEHQSKGQENNSSTAGYWNGMLGGGSW